MIEMKITAADGQDLYAQLMQLANTLIAASAPVGQEAPTTESPKALTASDTMPEKSGASISPEQQEPSEPKRRGRPPKASSESQSTLPAASTVSDKPTAPTAEASLPAKRPLDGLSDDAAVQVIKDKLTEYMRLKGPQTAFATLEKVTGVRKISLVAPDKRVALFDQLEMELKKND